MLYYIKRGDFLITEKIKKIFFVVKNEINEKMKAYNLTAAQALLLEYLNEMNGKMIIQKDICDYLSFKHSTVIDILKRLEEKELITKKTNYKSEISITEKGKKLIESAGIKKGFMEKELLKGFTKDEINQLDSYQSKILFNINKK